MSNKLFFYIIFRIALLGAIGILFSYLPDHLRDFFGDTLINKNTPFSVELVDDKWIWGTRHYWYAWTSFFIFIFSIIKALIDVVNVVESESL